jgi:hypothetical protein
MALPRPIIMNRFLRRLRIGVIVVLSVSWGAARADLPYIRLDRIFPLGGEAGSQVLVDLNGRDLDDVKVLHFDDPGLKAELVKPNQFRVTIAAGTPPGTHEVRASGKYGISAARLFAVSHGLTEVRETEPNDTLAQAQGVSMNGAVEGTSDSNGVDFFRFRAKAGDRVTIDCQALRLDSTLRASPTLYTADGKQLALATPYYERTDPLLDFRVPTDGDYIVGLHDLTYSGDLPYRLVISNRPRIDCAFPPAVVSGRPTRVTLWGSNIPAGRIGPRSAEGGLPLDGRKVLLAVGEDPAVSQGFRFINHPAAPGLGVRGAQVWPPDIPEPLNPVTLARATAPVIREDEPNDTLEGAQPLSRPTIVCGRFDTPGDADWFSFTAKAGETIALDLLCERIELPGDPFIVVMDAKGDELATFDDHGENVGFDNITMLLQLNRDPLGTFSAPADGLYRVLVQERNRRYGPRYLYALRIGTAEPDFYPVAFHETVDASQSNSIPTCPLIRRGGSAFYAVYLNRRDGFDGAVTVEAEGLPLGVTCPPVHIGPSAQLASIVFTAALDAPEWTGSIRLKAWATIADKRVERTVLGARRRWGEGNPNNASRAVRQLCLAVRSRAPYGLRTPEAILNVEAGKTLETKVTVQRYWPDFTDAIQLTGLNLPPGFEIPAADSPASGNEVPIKINVAADVPPGTYSIVLRGAAQVPFSPDPTATDRPKVRVSDPATPLTLEVKAPLQKP